MNFTKLLGQQVFKEHNYCPYQEKWIFFGKLQWTAYSWQIVNIAEVEPLNPINVTCDQNKHFACNKANKLLGAVNQDLKGSSY